MQLSNTSNVKGSSVRNSPRGIQSVVITIQIALYRFKIRKYLKKPKEGFYFVINLEHSSSWRGVVSVYSCILFYFVFFLSTPDYSQNMLSTNYYVIVVKHCDVCVTDCHMYHISNTRKVDIYILTTTKKRTYFIFFAST
jgi:hypothetical protein